jgi:hypothetical protein
MAIWARHHGRVESEFTLHPKTKSMKNLISILSRSRFAAALLLAGASGGLTAVVEASDKVPAADAAPKHGAAGGKKPAAATPAELKAMDAFLDSHAVIDDELRQHPGLADNPDFLKNHPEYAAFVAEHPGVADQLKEHPRYFVRRALVVQRRQPITPAEVKKLDAFLDQHPDVEQALEANPKLADDPKFVADHPELRKFLNDHPKVNGALASKPKATLQKEKNLDKREAKAGKS